MSLADALRKATWDPSLHPRAPAGPGGGRFAASGRSAVRGPLPTAGAVSGGRADEAKYPPSYGASTDHHSNVLVIGDSHTVMGGAGAQYPDYDVDAFIGRNSAGGLEALEDRLKGRHDTVVFDLATNDFSDPAALRRNLRTLRRAIGPDRELVLVNSMRREEWGPDGQDSANVAAAADRVLQHFAARTGATLVDWAGAAEKHPEWYLADNTHFTDEGYARRAAMIQRAVDRSLRKAARDGDGDGLIFDGTPQERPAPFQQVRSAWESLSAAAAVPDEDRAAIGKYSDASWGVNAALREGREPTGKNKAKYEALMRTIEASPGLPEDSRLVRTVPIDVVRGLEPGDELTDAGFLTATLVSRDHGPETTASRPDFAYGRSQADAQARKAAIYIDAPAGTKYAPGSDAFRELILEPGTTIRVTSFGDPLPRPRNVLEDAYDAPVVHAEIVPKRR